MRFALAFSALFWTGTSLLMGAPVGVAICALCVCGFFGLVAFGGGGE